MRNNSAYLLIVVILVIAIAANSFAQDLLDGNPTVFPAREAKVTGALRILGKLEAAVIHFWNNPDDTISWVWSVAKPGNYRVELNYSLDVAMTGGEMLFTAGDQQIIAPAQPTGKWSEFRTFVLGVVRVDKMGDIPVMLQGVQLPEVPGAALPDVLWLSLTLTNASATSKPFSQPSEFHGKPIFDGKTFVGWEGDLTWFRVVNGVVVAGDLHKHIPRNEFLCTTREFLDFELRVKVRMVNGTGNGGVQIRSQRVKGSREMIGYQADAADGCWGGLYDESRRRCFLGTRLNAVALATALKRDDWNAYIIRCEGPRTRLWLNGVLTLDYTEQDPAIPRAGHIGLQIHEGGPSEACYKDIELEELQPGTNSMH